MVFNFLLLIIHFIRKPGRNHNSKLKITKLEISQFNFQTPKLIIHYLQFKIQNSKIVH